MSSRMPANLLAVVEEEIVQEKASTLFQLGKRLENAIAELQQLEQQALGAEPDERAKLVLLHAEVRKDALQAHWFLLIQREAMGLRDHRAVDEHYPIPPRLR